jgi:hypothetical protein
MHVTVRWQTARSWDDPIVDETRVLYAVAHPTVMRPLYVGKADGSTVYKRAHARDKDALWNWLAEHGMDAHICLVGFPTTDGRLTRELLADVESLLIFNLKPHWNSQNTRRRGISRPGMEVFCANDWRWRKSFRDS